MPSSPTRFSRLRRFWTWPLKSLLGLVLIYLLFGYFAVNPLAKRILPWVGETKLASQLQADEVRFDPLRLSLTVTNLQLRRLDGGKLASFDRLFVDLESSGLFKWAWYLRDVRLSQPHALFEVGSNGKLNWSALLAKLNEDPSTSDTMPRVIIDHIVIEGGDIQYVARNRAEPFEAALAPLALELDGLSTLPAERGDYLIAARLPEQGGTLKWKGDMALNPVASNGKLEIQGIKLAKLASIINPASLPASPTTGDLSASFSYQFALVKDKPDIAFQQVKLGLDDVALNLPSTAKLALKQLQVNLPNLALTMQDQLQLKFQGLDVDLHALTLQYHDQALLQLPVAQLRGVDYDLAAQRASVGELMLDQGQVHATRDGRGSIDWQQAFAGKSSAAPDTPDASAAAPDKDAQPGLQWQVAALKLQHWQADYQDQSYVHALALQAKDFNLDVALDNHSGGIVLRNLTGSTGPLTLKSALAAQPAAVLQQLRLDGGEINLAQQTVNIAALKAHGLQTSVLQEPGKPPNWQAMLESKAGMAQASNDSHAGTSTPWKVALAQLALSDLGVHYEDRSLRSPVLVDVEQGTLNLRDVTLDSAKALPVQASLQLRQGGKLQADGQLTLQPLQAKLTLKLDELALKPYSPYLNQQAMLKLVGGQASSQGKLTLKQDKTLSLQYQGGFKVQQLVIDEEQGAPFLRWKNVSSDSLQFSLAPDRLHMQELRIVEPVGKIIIHEDRTLNVTRLMRTQPAANSSAPPKAQAAVKPAPATSQASVKSTHKPDAGFPVLVDRVRIDNANLEFADLSLKPQFGTHINSLSGVINSLSSDPATAAQVELDGKVDDYGSAKVRGSIQPFQVSEFTDLKLSFRNLEMNRLTPYSGKFAGRRIDSGKLSVDLEYNIKHRQLAGENKFIINKLRLGEKVDSPDAANLPLDLAIALLEDSDGVIDLDLPVSGNLDDPQFSYGKVVWKAIVNVLGKIVTSPFRALGKLFGTDSDKLEAVIFEPGSYKLDPPEQEKMITIAQALQKKPSISLSITPTYDTGLDTRALQEHSIRLQVAELSGTRLQPGEQPGPIDLNNAKTQSAIDSLADKVFERSKLQRIKDAITKSKQEKNADSVAMLEKLIQNVKISEADLQALAQQRAQAMQQAMQAAGVPGEHISVGAPASQQGDGKHIAVKMQLASSAKSGSQ